MPITKGSQGQFENLAVHNNPRNRHGKSVSEGSGLLTEPEKLLLVRDLI